MAVVQSQTLATPSQMSVSGLPAAPSENARLAELFKHWFETKPAITAEEIEQAHRLRYQVYCVENPFEDPAGNPNEMEMDEYDPHSVHSLLIHRPTQTTMGAVRLILPAKASAYRLPIQDVWQTERIPFPEETTAEISRYAISREFRRRAGEERYADVNWAKSEDSPVERKKLERRVLPHITLGLMKSVLRMCIEHDITHVCAVMEPALIRLLHRFGLEFEPIGPVVNYHGRRQPCYAALETLLKTSREARREFWEVGTDDGQLLPKAASGDS
ncbi:PEP-CTERM/exosortase system-associated acyltransferase [Pelagibius sp. Alg239-R121]|uniref:PEP-CTERM/exosortase system-associated acyltransferase n=1 Tax=Pelagibius sp. Alg239-R121 TaxID=2993448 RepID=UPI0024A6D22F|nr:PEP-CTERM/exosortase system-associated acyltransferase [Pelagibius sp. Alg239-R121]